MDEIKKPKTFRPRRSEGPAFNGSKAKLEMYDERWAAYSRMFIKTNDKCYACGSKSQVTDHIIPHKGDFKLFWKEDNYIPLCHKCHNYVTSKFDRYHRPGNPPTEKLEWLVRNRDYNNLSFRVFIVPIPLETLRTLRASGVLKLS